MLDFDRPSTLAAWCHSCGEEATIVVSLLKYVEFDMAMKAGHVRCDCGGELQRETKVKSLLLDAKGQPLG